MEEEQKRERSCASTLDDANQGYFTGLCTVFVATIQETKDRVSQLEAIFCSQLFPTFQTELAKFRNIAKRLERVKADAEQLWKQERQSLILELEHLQSSKHLLEEECQNLKDQNDDLSALVLEKQEILRNYDFEKDQLLAKLQRMEESGQNSKVDNADNAREMLMEEVSKMEEELKNERLKVSILQSEVERQRTSKQEAINQFKTLKRMYKNLRAQYDVVISLRGIASEKSSAILKKASNERKVNSDCSMQSSLAPQSNVCVESDVLSRNGNNVQVNEDCLMPSGIQETPDTAVAVRFSQDSANSMHKLDAQNYYKDCRENISEEVQRNRGHCNPVEDEETEEELTQSSVDVTTNKNDVGADEQTEDGIEPQADKQIEDGIRQGKYGQIQETLRESFRGVMNGNISSTASDIPRQCLQKRPLETKVHYEQVQNKSSAWRGTRLRQRTGVGVDLHDDFLDTPMENVLQALQRKNEGCPQGSESTPPKSEGFLSSGKKSFCEISKQTSAGVDFGLSNEEDDETQPMNHDHGRTPSAKSSSKSAIVPKELSTNEGPVDSSGRLQEPTLKQTLKNGVNYKYNEPVRKKADREALKGVQCNQCKMFYDAVKEDNDGRGDVHCEHHAEVSRHRYRYVPPATPEGFWNLGFDSDL